MAGGNGPREVWMPVAGYEDQYEVSNLGAVRRCGSSRLLLPATTHGYQHVTLSQNGKTRNYRVHRLVLEAFCGPPPFEGAYGCHNDGNRQNNRLTNLRWGSGVENQADSRRHGTMCQGERVFGAKLNADKVRQIRRRAAAGEVNPKIANDFGVSASTVHLIRHNRIWRHV